MIPNKIVIIGASTVYGWVDPGIGGFVGRLRAYLENKKPFSTVYNLGISGQTCKEITSRLKLEVPPREPNLILISLGANDSAREKSPDSNNKTSLIDFKNDVAELLKESTKIAKTLFLGSFPLDDSKTSPIPGTKLYYSNIELEKYVSIASEVSASLDVPYLDLFSLWKKIDYYKYLHSDGLHCNALGHQELFNEVKKFIEKHSEMNLL